MHDSPHLPIHLAGVLIDPELVRKYETKRPIYTAYPTADSFVDTYDALTHQNTLQDREPRRGPGSISSQLSLYVHIPFCNENCHFCACDRVITKDHRRGAEYVRHLEREFRLVASMLAGGKRVEQVHLGGGTPTFLSTSELEILMRSLGEHFELLPGDYTIEVDPRTVDDTKIGVLGKLGFRQMSLGVQDFDPDVQDAVNRPQTAEVTARAIASAREHGFNLINIDLMTGLPRQSVAGFSETIDLTLGLKPDRIALYDYFHLPDAFESQRQIDACDLPSLEGKLRLTTLAYNRLTDAGYVNIGVNHFALPGDVLAIAARRAGLHKTFQGYAAHPENDLLAFGISAISRIGGACSQNAKTLEEYYDRLNRGELPVLRGVILNADDVRRRAVIQSLICHFELSIESFELAYLVNFREYFANEWDKLEAMEHDGLVTLEPDWISVTPSGRLLVHVIAMVFDKHRSRNEHPAHISDGN